MTLLRNLIITLAKGTYRIIDVFSIIWPYLKKIKQKGPIMVYVLNQNGQPLMPTNRHGKVKHLLKNNLARVVTRCPFTIQLLYESTNYTQELTLGVDAGSKHIGLSVVSEKCEVYSGVVELRNDITDLLAAKRALRSSRRNHLRYRKARFSNRKKSKQPGWIAPSVRNKINSHLTVVAKIHQILPVSKIIVETASFDIQKIKNPDIKGIEYQQGESTDFWNIREYVLFRDNHTCQCCKGKSKDKRLNVHHIESRKTGGNAQNNLITLCETCHTGYHKGIIELPKNIKRGMSFRHAAFMGIMRWAFYDELKTIYTDVSNTYGYITKNTRISQELPKEHNVDAYCIAGKISSKRTDEYYYQRKVRSHNRQIHKANKIKGGRLKLNQAPYEVKGFRLFDKVRYEGKECFISGRRSTGYFKLITLDGTIVHQSASHKKLTLIEPKKSYLIERRKVG